MKRGRRDCSTSEVSERRRARLRLREQELQRSPGARHELAAQEAGDGQREEGAGQVRVTWPVPNVFSDGLHHVDLAITDRDALAMYDPWEEAASFTAVKEEKTPYIVTPATTLVVTKAGGAADA